MTLVSRLFRDTHVLARSSLMRNVHRSMAQNQKHLDRTADNTREEVISHATVIGIRNESTTVKSLTLRVKRGDLTFKAGQWVDMFIPGLETVGGFSICSSPCDLSLHRTLELAVKYSTHPPAKWVHTQCKEGSDVSLRVGGDFYYDPQTSRDRDLLLIAGGVGINPMYSMVQHFGDLCSKGNNSVGEKSAQDVSRVMLLYSAQTVEELIFEDKLTAICDQHTNVNSKLFVTRQRPSAGCQNTSIIYDRISNELVKNCFDWLRQEKTLAYICGPFPMIKDMETVLLTLGVPETSIKYEKWW